MTAVIEYKASEFNRRVAYIIAFSSVDQIEDIEDIETYIESAK